MSEFAALVNATLIFSRTLTTRIDPETGNEIPNTVERFEADAYLKRSIVSYPQASIAPMLPVGTFRVEGYTDGRLPDWCQLPIDPAIPCTIKNLGSGYLKFEGKIQVAYEEVSSIGDTTPIQGIFTIQGSG